MNTTVIWKVCVKGRINKTAARDENIGKMRNRPCLSTFKADSNRKLKNINYQL